MSDLAGLIARLEAATEGSQELDEAIARWFACIDYATWRNRPGPRNFTTSLAAAVTLYKLKPRVIPSDPLEACIAALKAREA